MTDARRATAPAHTTAYVPVTQACTIVMSHRSRTTRAGHRSVRISLTHVDSSSSIVDNLESSIMWAAPTSMETIMEIDFDRRHAFYFNTDGNIRPISAHRLDRLWRGEPGAEMPELSGQRVRFALLHIERFSMPPRVVVEHLPRAHLDTQGNLDLEHQYAQLQADADNLERTNYVAEPASTEAESTWRPDPTTRRRLIVATQPSYVPPRPQSTLHHRGHTTMHGGPRRPASLPATRPTPHRRPATSPAPASPRR